MTFVTTARTGRPLSADPQRLRAMLRAYAMIAAPLGLGLAATAENATLVLLGAQWNGAVPYLQLIAPASAMYAVYKLIASSLLGSGDARHAAMLSMAGTASMALGITIAVQTGGGVIEVAIAALCVSVLILVTGVIAMAYKAGTSALSLLLAVVRPFGAAALMLLAVRRIDWSAAAPLLELAAQAAAGGVIYGVFAGLIWRVSGRPEGAEKSALDILHMAWRRVVPQP